MLSGGISIPSESDLNSDTYKIPGTYYCHKTSNAKTLINCPFESAFLLKVSYGTGIDFPVQSFVEFRTRKIAERYYDINLEKWSDWVYFSDDATLANNLLSTAPYTVAFDEITPGAAQTKSVSVHRDGYKAIGCAGWANTKSSNFYLYQCSVNDSEMLSAFAKNAGDSTIPSGATVIVNVLFVKDS